ncbi:hypothetical protein N7528_000450 [Penicillium herquei]|nr:hypothetical protein N7528_000450 [Penicillium herquei]
MDGVGPNPRDKNGLCLLSLDGGGVRGLSSLFILRDVMNQLNRERDLSSILKPCDIFDLIGGTSTGGLIAIMLGRLELSVDECIEAYGELIETVFGEKISNIPVDWAGNIRAQFDSKKLKAAIEHVIVRAGFKSTDLMNDGNSRSTRVFVCTTAKDTLHVTRLRSYSVSNEDTLSPTICEAALATSAATGFFESVQIGNRQFVDGAFGANNPVEEVEEEASDIWCTASREIKPLVKCFLTLGTGCPANVSMSNNMLQFLSKTLVRLATKPESTERRFMARWSNESKENRLFRFNVDQGLQDVHMTDYSKRGLMESATHDYLQHTTQKTRIRDCILNLASKEGRWNTEYHEIKEYEARKFQAKILSTVHASQGLARSPACWVVPFERNSKFVDREQVNHIKRKLFALNQAGNFAIVGLGGVGKTQIAIEIAYQARSLFPDCAVLWIPTVDTESLENAYQDIAYQMRLEFDPKKEDVKSVVQKHLSHNYPGRWLMIFDNADDLDMWVEDSENCHAKGLRTFLPKSDRGVVIFTTRSNRVAQYLAATDIIRISELEEQKATKILRNSLHDKSLLEDTVNTQQLLERLTYLPLAIVQAASFINENGMNISSYVTLLDGQDEDVIGLLSEEFEDEGRYKSIRNPVATTWLTSFKQLRREHDLAYQYMCFMSCINSKDIPLSLLPRAPPLEQQKAIGVLASYSFVKTLQNGTRLDMHRLVHLATRNWLQSLQLLHDWRSYALRIISATFPPLDQRIEARAALSHSLEIVKSTSDYPITRERAWLIGLCAEAGLWNGRAREFIGPYHQALEYYDEMFGPEAPQTLILRARLANAYQFIEEYEKSSIILQEVIDVEQRINDPESESIMLLRAQLANAYRNTGKLDEAEKLQETSIRFFLDHFSIDSSILLTGLSQMSSIYLDQGRILEAEKLADITLDLTKRFKAADNPWKPYAVSNLAQCYMFQWKRKEAEQLYLDVLETEREIFGSEHLQVLHHTHSLAVIIKCQGRHKEALTMMTENARLYAKVLGPDHSSTKTGYEYLEEWTTYNPFVRLRYVIPQIERNSWNITRWKRYPKQKVMWGLYSGRRRRKDDSFIREVKRKLDSMLAPSHVSTEGNLVDSSDNLKSTYVQGKDDLSARSQGQISKNESSSW